MLRRQRSGSVVCPSCGRLVGVKDARCLNCGRVMPALWGFAPALRALGGDLGFDKIVIGSCSLLYLLTLVATPGWPGSASGLGILTPAGSSLLRFGASGPLPVFVLDRWWTVLSAGWLHGNLLHILFNMLWVRQLAPAALSLYGTSRTVVIYTLSSLLGFLASAVGGGYLPVLRWILGGSPVSLSVGASAAIFGLLGAMVYAGRRGVAGHLGRQAWMYALILFAFGLLFPGVDNWAHAGGFAGGYLLGRWMDPMREARLDHTLAALLCLTASVAAVVASLVVPLPQP